MAFQDEASALSSRLHLGELKRPVVIGAVVVALLVMAAVGVGAARALSTEGFAVTKEQPAQAASMAEESDAAGRESAAQQVCVYVSGAVAAPDVYFLDEGSRVADAIVAAGGFTDEAAVDALNLARVLNDGEQIAVPTEEAVAATIGGGGPQGASPAAASASAGSSTAGGLVNINSADSAALQTLDGVGEATAKKIIADREANGPFRTIEDLKRVSGIGDKKFENLRDSICV